MHQPIRHVSLWRMLAVAVSLALALGPALPTGAATTTMEASAYGHMKKFMGAYDSAGFSRVVKIGNLTTYRATLTSVELRVNPNLDSVAEYDPKTKTITFSKDPRTIGSSESLAFGETVWHEITHAIEDAHGDIGYFDSEEYAERNTDYMTHVARVALPLLRKMEKDALAGLSAAKLEVRWRAFVKQVGVASTLPSTKAYPPNYEIMRQWFGFQVNPEQIKKMYLTNKAFSYPKWSRLRTALKGEPLNWTGEWNTNWGVMSITQSGSVIRGAYTHDHGKLEGTASGRTITGRWSEAPSYAGPNDAGPIKFTLAADGKSFSGTWNYDGGGGGSWSGTRLR